MEDFVERVANLSIPTIPNIIAYLILMSLFVMVLYLQGYRNKTFMCASFAQASVSRLSYRGKVAR